MMCRAGLVGLVLLGFFRVAHAQEAAPASYALLVGSNRPGLGQQELRFAGQDALRFEEVLVELGGFPRNHIETLLDPGADEVSAALDRVAERLAEHKRRDEPSVFLFYYSGHARALALNLGRDEIGLVELKQTLETLPTTVTLVLLDACQTGAISQVKGVEPAVDFSHNSVAGLNTAGMAVMASSAASELSQESEQLGGSFFTHHLITGLRGAADSDMDGRVTLSEAYRYAYNRTLVSTASTAVGRQHVTLETDLRGKGEMVLSRPSAADARLSFPEDLEAEVVIHRADSQVVVAEVIKATGSALRLALPVGDYAALVRRGERVERCALSLVAGRVVELELAGCEEIPLDQVEVKGQAPGVEPLETVGVELAVGGLWGKGGAYVETLREFGFEERGFLFSEGYLTAAVTWSATRYLGLVLSFSSLTYGEHARDIREMSGDSRTQRFEWSAYRIGAGVRGGLPLAGGWLVPYVQAGGGLSLGFTDWRDEGLTDSETHYGYFLSVAGGLQLMPTFRHFRHIGSFVQAEYLFAPTVDNLTGDTLDAGGFAFSVGVRAAF